jgi:hypothetical protein
MTNYQGNGGRFSFSVAARRQTAANFSALFQMAALCRDAATDGRNIYANPGARIFMETADDSSAPWGEGRVEGGRIIPLFA